jgi:hypothetical protein
MVQNVGNKRLREYLLKKDGWSPAADEYNTYRRKGLCAEDPSSVLTMNKDGYPSLD